MLIEKLKEKMDHEEDSMVDEKLEEELIKKGFGRRPNQLAGKVDE